MPSYVPNDRIKSKLEESKGALETTERNWATPHRRLLLADPDERRELSRKVVRVPLLDADPIERSLESRTIV